MLADECVRLGADILKRIWPISAGTGLHTKLGRTAMPAFVGEQTADPPLKRQAIPPLSPEFGGPH